MSKSPILIIAGEPKSVFFEIFLKSQRTRYKSPIILIGNEKSLRIELKKFKSKKKINLLDGNEITIKKLSNKDINLINVDLDLNNQGSQKYIEQCFKIALKLIKNKFAYKLINGPIDKSSFLNKKFLGITEYISNKLNIKNTGMLIYNKKIAVCPITTHLPLKLVVRNINKEIIKKKIMLVNEFYIKNFNLRPKIAVTGLNPHCESVSKFNEDEKIIRPAINMIKKKMINVKGPFPADTIFSKKNRKIYDVVIGMYHDQVLSPLKALYEFDAINITMGLPFIRVTPDHGPNKNMIGKNLSSPKSLIKALKFLDQR